MKQSFWKTKVFLPTPSRFNDLTKNTLDQTAKIKDQAKKIEEMTERIKELQSAKQDDRVRMFQNALRLSSFSANSQRDEFKKYCNDLNSNEQLNMHYFQQMRGEKLQSFKAGSEYQAWRVSEEAQILLLWGYNNDSIWNEAECWLSPVATSTIDELSQNSYLAYSIIRNGRAAHDVLSVILLQLLRLKKECLQNESQYAELNSDLEKYCLIGNGDEHSDENEKAKLGALEKISARIIGFFAPSETLYIVIDRVDQCWHRTLNHRKALLDVLVKMVEAADCKLKVLAVINGYDWDSQKYDFNSRRGKKLIKEQQVKS